MRSLIGWYLFCRHLTSDYLDKGASTEEIELGEDKSTAEKVLEVLEHVCIKTGVSLRKKSSYLSALVKLLASSSGDGTADLGLRIKEIMLW